MALLRALEAAAAQLQGPVRGGIVRKAQRSRVEPAGFDVVAVLVRLAPAKRRAFDLQVAEDVAERHDSVGDVRGVEPVVRDRRFRIVLAGKPVHESRRSQRRLTGKADIREYRAAVRKRAAVARRQFHEEVVRMLPVDERGAMPRSPSMPSPSGRCPIIMSMLVLNVLVSPLCPPWRS